MYRRTPAVVIAAAAASTVECLESRTLFALTTFTVDPALSSLRLSGEVADVLDLEEQRNGSLVAAYDGTVLADVAPGSIAFPGGSNVVAKATRSYSPGDGPANYGAESETGGIFSVKIGEAAVRNFRFDLESVALAVGESGAFGASGLDLRTTGGKLEYDLRVGSDGDVDLDGETVNNNGAGNATIRGVGENLTLTIPIDINLNEDSAELRLRGTIVANAGTGAPVDPNAVRLGDGSLIKSVSFSDANGTLATISVKGGGSADVRFQNATAQTAGKAGSVTVSGDGLALLGVDAVGTTARTKIAIAGKGGEDGVVVIPSLTTDGAAGTLGGRGVTFTGPVTINGRLNSLTAANVATATVTADSIGAVKVTGDVTDSTITLDAPFASGTFALGKLGVGGAFSRSRVMAAGAIGAIKATTLIRADFYSAVSGTAARFPVTTDLSAEGSIGNVTSKNFADTVIAADTLGKLKLGLVVVDNEANLFGLTADAFGGLQATSPVGEKLKLPATDDPAILVAALAAQPFQTGDFTIRLA